MTRSVGGESLQRACPREVVQPRQERTLIPIIPHLVQFGKQGAIHVLVNAALTEREKG